MGIEEPELALHPAAAGVLIDSLREAADTAQVLVTSHSPDLLDDLWANVGKKMGIRSMTSDVSSASYDTWKNEAATKKTPSSTSTRDAYRRSIAQRAIRYFETNENVQQNMQHPIVEVVPDVESI